MTKIAAIIGGGVIGGGWAARFALSGWDVAIFDPDPEAERKISEVMANARRSLPALSDVALPPESQVKIVPTLADAVTDADWIQESAPERLEMKHKIFAEIQTHCRKDALIGSSTSGFKPSELQQGALRPNQIFVAHPFNPVYLLPLIELVGDDATTTRAQAVLTEIGMKPLKLRKEIDAHVADRFLEAVWREALWLIKDGIATTEEIDDAIRFGFGLRWGQMGLFETYRVAGGEAGMAHFIEQFGPCLQWPWTKLMDVPELTDDLVQRIASQSDAQSGAHTIRELERIRDDNLVSMMRSLKGRDWGAGALLNAHDARLDGKADPDFTKPIISVARAIPIDWTDYNGHMNESRYGQLWSDAADALMRMIGADDAYIKSGFSYFTADTHTKFRNECHAGDNVTVVTTILEGAGKKLRLFHELKNAAGDVVATCNQFLLHVSLETRKSCDPAAHVSDKLATIIAAQAALPKPEHS
ncbi:carnitine 3-dehydrogenase [Sulfitobacter sp. W002]|uniref:carnitine 3-dehydrogenase n=1 Tax=Sulfitobacter sp. W002 TaxID=2867024 RepID=UPI0021A8A460|nr:carnitine 3-dehydrogenase [Sulfitobacter sp. W002]UWR28688.1 carnitine 3-dehydrogenase [Sulfitobacter sp. W002]